jgi:metallo-beta-lactamase family protein
VFVGYQAQGTLGRQLVDGAREVTLWGERIRVAAQIHTVGGLSAHADQAGLMGWVRHFRDRPPVALVHGEPTARDLLAQQLRRTLKLRVLTPQLKSSLDLLAL